MDTNYGPETEQHNRKREMLRISPLRYDQLTRPQPEVDIIIRRVSVEVDSLLIVGMTRPVRMIGTISVSVAGLTAA